MTDTQSITYRPNPTPPIRDERQLLGGYTVKYDDDCAVFIPHLGWPGTVSAEPLDPSVPEHRAIIESSANELRDHIRDDRSTL